MIRSPRVFLLLVPMTALRVPVLPAQSASTLLMVPDSKTIVVLLATTFARFGMDEGRDFADMFLARTD